ncbi:hypothetical protein QFC22_000298 [Naganishia vaughanmartiniae]|uniref:Uncharacterized protein n=1 Tax=Naganishia vaughanmartiniae TaxID=1424756 RepID=A0ACC2XNB2_9TREE|nr:hypothetical protein QFC22_000298 [Naganishia vaughanmartiniae]
MSTLLALQKDLQQELQLMNEFAEENLKSYQVWHHRLTLITHMEPQLSELTKEIDFIHDSLMPDPKNYHTWAYLNWLYSTFSNLPEERGGDRFSSQSWMAELAWCERMLDSNYRFSRSRSTEGHEWLSDKVELLSGDDKVDEHVIGRGDGRNNSAWSWRWYLVVSRKGAKLDAKTELEYALSQIRAIPHNASAWNYLRGIHKHFKLPLSQSLPAILPFSTTPAPSVTSSIPRKPPPVNTPANPDTPLPVPFAIEWLADCNAEQAAAKSSSDAYADAAGLYHELAERWDVMRKTYWRFRQTEMLRRASDLKRAESVAAAAQEA